MEREKTLDTLVEDIYDIMLNGADVSDEVALSLGQNIADVLKRRLTEARHERKPTLRVSNIGTEPRQLWYDLHGYEGEALKPHTLLMFMLGDIIEEVLLALTEIAGHTVTNQQGEVEIEGIKGHMDAVIDGHVVDVKSASPMAFDKFKYNEMTDANDAFGYRQQLSAYAQAIDEDLIESRDAAFLAMNKVTGELALMKMYEMEQTDPVERIRFMKELMERDTPPTLEEAPINIVPDGKSGNMKLGVPHSYHSQKFNYLPDLRMFLYSNGPRFLTEVVKEPRVPEVDPKTGEIINKEEDN